MEIKVSDRGFEFLVTDKYPPNGTETRIVSQSSAIGDYDDSMDKPGSSYLWIGDAHLDRKQVKRLVKHLKHWLNTGRLSLENKQ